MPQPLPFDELLAALKARGLPIGLREHLLVGRLLDRWPGTDLGPLRSALSALLARDPEEVKLVRSTFDELYGGVTEPAAPPAPAPPPPLPAPRRRWGRIAGIALAALLLASSLGQDTPPPVEVEVPAAQGAPERPPDAPEPPTIPDEILRPDPLRALAAAGGLATFLFLWLYGGRIKREARSLGRRRWRREAEALPRPYRYRPDLSGLAPPFPAATLDEAAQVLGRRAPAPPRPQDLDVDRSLQKTLDAGLAPEIVLREQSTTPVLLILLDIGGEMRPWRRSVDALLTGLASRGVPLDIWRFQADAGRVFRTPGGEALSLERLARLRSASPLLVISTGEGLVAGEESCTAPWVRVLAAWERRAWLHPVPDAVYWRPVLREAPLDVWPLTPGGVLAAARQLAGTGAPPRSTAPVFPHRPVTPLDVDRLRWLLTLTPGRDPDLVERLRQQVFPNTPPAALVEALEAPPLQTPPPLAPPAEEVHAALADLLAASSPPPGSAAWERWRLDVALQTAQVPERRDEALRELQDLARGPLAAEVERATDRLPQTLRKPLRQSLGARAEQEGRAAARAEGPPRPRWRWPDLVELAATLACVLLLFWGLERFFKQPAPVEMAKVYTLEVDEEGKELALIAYQLRRAPVRAQLYQHDRPLETLEFKDGLAAIKLEPGERGHWYYLRALLSEEELAISNRVWVPLGTEPPIDLQQPDQTTDLETIPQIDDGPDETPVSIADNDPPAAETTTAPLTTEMTPGPEVAEPDKSPSRGMGYLEILGFPEGLQPGALLLLNNAGQRSRWGGENPISLIAGVYRLTLEDYGYEETVVVRAGDTVSVQLERRSPAQIQEDLTRVIEEELAPRIDNVSPAYTRNGSFSNLTIEGANFDPKATVEIAIPGPEGITLECSVQPTRIECTAEVPPGTPRGDWDLTVTNPDGQSATQKGAISIYLVGS